MHSLCRTGCLMLTVAFLVTTLLPVSGQAASPRKCIRETCKPLKRQCISHFEDQFTAAKGACKETENRKKCRKVERKDFRGNKKRCKDSFKACRSCCKTDQSAGALGGCGTGLVTDCPPNAAGGPNLAVFTVAAGGDLDVGWTGVGHNQGVLAGVEALACLQDCDTDSDPVCTGTGPVGEESFNGTTYGPPLPMLAADIATCVVSEFTEDITVRKLNLQTGEIEMRVKLNSVVHLTGDKKIPCPTCSGESIGAVGTCQGLTDAVGRSCTTEGITEKFGNTSSDCLPFAADNAGELEVVLDPITSGTAILQATNECPRGSCPCPGGGNPTLMNLCDDPNSCSLDVCVANGGSDDVRNGFQLGVDQACCKRGREIIPCFIDDISRTGEAVPAEPLWPDPTYPKTATVLKLAGVFCTPPTNSGTINQPTGLGGPGAFVVPVETYIDFFP